MDHGGVGLGIHGPGSLSDGDRGMVGSPTGGRDSSTAASTSSSSSQGGGGGLTSSTKTAKMTKENHIMNMHRVLQEQHSLPIQRMGDIESYLRMKYDLEQDDEQLNDGN